MPLLDRCTKCKTLKDVKKIGKNGVCSDCMEQAIVNEPPVKVQAPEEIVIISGDESKSFKTFKEAGEFLGVSYQAAGKAKKEGKEINGWRFT